ncbi:MAG: arginine repressor [Actinomycetota bacterium]
MISRDRIDRKRMIAEAIASDLIHSQADVVKTLRRHGIRVTQATASRDLEELGAVRGKGLDGRMVYQLPKTPPVLLGERTLEIKSNGQMLVVKTAPGAAHLVASRIDSATIQGVMGTIAGDDTIFVALEKASISGRVSESIVELVDGSLSRGKRRPSKRRVKR